jgi:holo-[acyl-carrier protein] synthase
MIPAETGVDIIEIERIAGTLARFNGRFLDRIYTTAEQRYCGHRVERLAGRFAAKEAVSKALGVGIRRLSWRDIEVLPNPSGKPEVVLHGRAWQVAQQHGIVGLSLSISHSRELAIAYAIAWRVER